MSAAISARGKCPVVEPDFVDASDEVFAPHTIAADAQRAVRHDHGAARRRARDLNRVHEQPDRLAVVCRRQMAPLPDRELRRLMRRRVEAGDLHVPARSERVTVRIERVGVAGRGLLEDHRAPAVERRRVDPGFDGHSRGEVQQAVRGNGHPVVDAVELQRLSKPPGLPRRAEDRSMELVA